MWPGPHLTVGLDRAVLIPSQVVSGTVASSVPLDGATSARVDLGYRTTELVFKSPYGNGVFGALMDVLAIFDPHSDTDSKRETRWIPVASSEVAIGELAAGRGRFEIPMPRFAPATVDMVADWMVWARVFYANGGELGGSAALRLLRTSEPYEELRLVNEDGAGDVGLLLRVTSARPGETIHGSVRLNAPGDLHVKQVAVQLGRQLILMKSSDKPPNRHVGLKDVEAVLAADEVVGPGVRDWPFELRVPADAEPSSRGEISAQRWWVTAEVDYKGFGAKTNVARREVIVYNAPWRPADISDRSELIGPSGMRPADSR